MILFEQGAREQLHWAAFLIARLVTVLLVITGLWL